MIEVVLNGEVTQIEAGLTLASWLEAIGRDPRTVAIERNGEIVARSSYHQTRLEPDDRLEVVHFVQGG